jgi:hypothetical protein
MGGSFRPSRENHFHTLIEPDLVAVLDGGEIDSFTANLHVAVSEYVEGNPDSSGGQKIEENVTGKNARIRESLRWMSTKGFIAPTKERKCDLLSAGEAHFCRFPFLAIEGSKRRLVTESF